MADQQKILLKLEKDIKKNKSSRYENSFWKHIASEPQFEDVHLTK